MTRKLNTTLGFYVPSFLRMHVGTKKSLQNLQNLNDPYIASIYLHEYTHFIQDVRILGDRPQFNAAVIVEQLEAALEEFRSAETALNGNGDISVE